MENITEQKKMFKIGVISGKGGVGKTTVSGSLSYLFDSQNHKIIAADCDVDAPNLGILFKTDEIYEVIVSKTTEKSLFLENICINCGKCIEEEFCAFHALKWDSEKLIPIVNDLACEGCGACKELCSEHAFEINAVDSGIVTHERSVYGFPLVWGETRLGATSSGKLISEIKEYISNISQNNDLKILIIDGPPGIGCTVIATVTDLNYVIVMVEPSSAALHDADRAIGVLNQMQRKFGIVINKADAWSEGYDMVKKYAKQIGIPIIGEIPVDNAIPYATVKGLPVVVDSPDSPASKALKSLYRFLIENVVADEYLE